MKNKYHIHLNGPEVGSLDKIITMIAANNSEKELYTLDDLYSVCRAEKILYPTLYRKADYFIDEENQELICHQPEEIGCIYWTVILCDVYEINDENIENFSNN